MKSNIGFGNQDNEEGRVVWRKRFGEITYCVLKEFGFNPIEVAEECGMHDSTFRAWKMGRSCPVIGSATYTALMEFIRSNIDNDPIKRPVLFDQIRSILSEEAYVFNILKSEFNTTADVIVEILHYCIRMSKGQSRGVRDASQVGKLGETAVLNRTRMVVFDFDGTLTSPYVKRTIWERLWVEMDYDIKDCHDVYMSFQSGKIDLHQLGVMTQKKFKDHNMMRKDFDAIVEDTELLCGVQETFEKLEEMNIKVFILSDSIRYIIRKVLGGLCQYCDDISANEVLFDAEGMFTQFVHTKYPYKDKSDYITDKAIEYGIAPQDVLFVGNSKCDEHAYKSGARTLCINPKATSYVEKAVWNDCIYECRDLREIFDYV